MLLSVSVFCSIRAAAFFFLCFVVALSGFSLYMLQGLSCEAWQLPLGFALSSSQPWHEIALVRCRVR